MVQSTLQSPDFFLLPTFTTVVKYQNGYIHATEEDNFFFMVVPTPPVYHEFFHKIKINTGYFGVCS